ncbi:MAG: LUD domain-containing protein [Nocardioidaceae bacterium]
MSARDDVLAACRRAPAGAATRVEVPRDYRDATPALGVEELLDLFVERVEDYRATVTRCTADEVARHLAAEAQGGTLVVPPGLPWPVPGAVVDDPGHPLSAAELDRLDGVVTAAAVGIALTGTIVLDHRPDQGRRALSLVPDLHVCVVRADQVVATVPEAVGRLDPRRPQTWVSGPSATSDIELSRVEGVHGPRTLRVLLVDG